MSTYFEVLNVPQRQPTESVQHYNDTLFEAFQSTTMTPTRKLAYIVLTQQYDIYVQLYCSSTLYDVLGVAKTATDDEIKKAYRALSLKLHPDRCVNADPCLQEQAVENQKRISTAFTTLSTKRAEYDRNPKGDDEDDFPDFDDDAWAGSNSEAEESDGSYRSSTSPPRKRRARGGGATRGTARDGTARGGTARGGTARGGTTRGGTARGGTARGSGATRGTTRGGAARGGGARKKAPSPPPAPEAPAQHYIKTINVSLFQLYRGFTAKVEFEASSGINDARKTCHVSLAVPPRTSPGLFMVLKQAGLYRPGLEIREDVHIVLQLDEVFPPYSMRGQDLIVQHTVDLHVALRGTGITRALMPDHQLEDFRLTESVQELQELTFLGRGLKQHSTGFVGCVILCFHIRYPPVSVRALIADYIEDQINVN
jgi:DnaJ-class molecular chaperone